MKNWTKILPFFVVEWLSKGPFLPKVTVGKREGTWIYKNTFIGERKK